MNNWLKVKFTFTDCEWQEEKRQAALVDRGIDFADIRTFLEDGEGVQRVDQRKDYREVRMQGMAKIEVKVLFFAFTIRAPVVARLISARRANAREVRAYKEAMGDEKKT